MPKPAAIQAVLEDASAAGTVDVSATVRGGGRTGQAGAVRMGLARALVKMNPDWHSPMAKAQHLRRDAVVEEPEQGDDHEQPVQRRALVEDDARLLPQHAGLLEFKLELVDHGPFTERCVYKDCAAGNLPEKTRKSLYRTSHPIGS